MIRRVPIRPAPPSRAFANGANAFPPVGEVVTQHEHGPDECPSCYECPGCGGADGSTPVRKYLAVRQGVARLICADCEGTGSLCPRREPS